MIRYLLPSLTLIGLAACSPGSTFSPPTVDQCIRAEAFQSCMRALPVGPQVAKYNDWDEVVDSCAQSAYYLALRPHAVIPEQCRSQ
jgi:hypothetical protein